MRRAADCSQLQLAPARSTAHARTIGTSSVTSCCSAISASLEASVAGSSVSAAGAPAGRLPLAGVGAGACGPAPPGVGAPALGGTSSEGPGTPWVEVSGVALASPANSSAAGLGMALAQAEPGAEGRERFDTTVSGSGGSLAPMAHWAKATVLSSTLITCRTGGGDRVGHCLH